MVLIPVLTWYGHQGHTNPFLYHPNIQISSLENIPVLSLFETTYKDTAYQFELIFNEDYRDSDSVITRIVLSSDGFLTLPGNSADTTLNHPQLYGNRRDSILSFTYYDWDFIVPFVSASESFGLKPCDILVLRGFSREELLRWRQLAAPRLTIWVTEEQENNMPGNIIVWNSDEKISIKEGRHKKLLSFPSKS